MIDSCDNWFQVLKDEDRKAKKEHRCCECWRVIKIGEIYNYQAGVGDGFDTYKTCKHCIVPRDFIQKKCRGFVYESVREDLYEHTHVKEWGYQAARLHVAMRRKWKRFKSDELMPTPKAY